MVESEDWGAGANVTLKVFYNVFDGVYEDKMGFMRITCAMKLQCDVLLFHIILKRG